MKKKNVIAIAALVAAGFVAFSFDVQDNNGRAGRTGSPNEQTCINGCHSSFALNDGTGSVSITSSNMTNWEYMPGDTYTVSVTVDRVGNSLFGLGVECLTGSTPAQNAGTLLISNSAETTIKSITVNSVLRRNVVHKLNGGVGTNSKTFTFKWIAPTSNVGNVTFYAAGNAANGNNSTSGDHIYTTSQVVTPSPNIGIAEQEQSGFSLCPNPAHDHLTVTYESNAGNTIDVQLFSLDGKQISTLYAEESDGMKHEETIQLPADLPAGVYFVRFSDGEKVSTRRIIIQ